jgi:hypothetical protein
MYYIYIFFYADKGIAPIFTGHEPVMLLLHQPALARYETCTHIYRLQNGCITIMQTRRKTIFFIMDKCIFS